MSLEGFRFSRVSVHHGRRQPALELEDVNGNDAVDALEEELSKHLGEIKIGNPIYLVNGQTSPPEVDVNNIPRDAQYFIIQELQRMDRSIHVEMCFGSQSELDLAVDAQTGTLLDLSRLGGVRRFRVIFHAPKTGSEILMISEVVGKGHAGEHLLSRLSKYAQYSAVAQGKEFWVRWMPSDVVDPSRADSIISDGNLERIRLRQNKFDSEGRRREACIEYTTLGLGHARVEPLKAIIREWIDRSKIQKDQDSLRTAGVQDICSLLEIGDDIEFDRAFVTFVENGKQQTVSPEKLDDLFVYPLGETRLPGRRFAQATDSAASRIAAHMDVAISLPNW